MRPRSFVILSVVLLAQAGMFYGFSRKEHIPVRKPLADFVMPAEWQKLQDVELHQEELDVLQADDVVSRVYDEPSTGRAAALFVAFFDTQKTGKAPHSPKNCLPGAGWIPSHSEIVKIDVPGAPIPLQANRYIVSKGDNQSVVIYWYQSHNRTVASEYWAKFYTVADSIRYNRSDTALVRVVVGVTGGDVQGAIQTATDFTKSLFIPLTHYLPS